MVILKNNTSNTIGFTLIELMIVITIIGILASFITVSTRKALDRAKIAKTLAWDSSLNSSLGADCVGDWEFDTGQGNIARDYSGNGNDGTIYGATWTDDTPNHSLGKALSFNGSSDYVDCGNDASLNPTDEITLEAWAKANSLTNWSGIVTNKKDANHGINLQMGTSDHIASLVSNGSSWVYVMTSWKPSVGVWYHIVITHSGSINKLYVNGNLEDTETMDLAYSSPRTKTVIGCFYYGSSCSLPFNGVIDQVRIYSKALDTAEIKEHYLAGLKRHQNLVMNHQ